MTINNIEKESGYINLKQYLILFLPIALMTFSTNLFPTVEKILLASLSKENMEASLSAFYAVQIFQLAFVSLATMAQVFVGNWSGEKKWNQIGPGIWQFIWFSLLSLVITLPFGYLYGNFYFSGTIIEEIVLPYYYSLLAMSFLFPLGGALTCFFLGRGKTYFIFITTLICHLIKLPIGYALIFGWKWIPSLGLMGGALSIFITQLVFCLALFVVFLNKENHSLYHTRDWRFKWPLFWECIQPGILRAMNRLLTMANWGAIAYLMTQGGENHLLILSIGGTLILFTTFFGEAICLAQMTVVSQILGSKKYQSLYLAFRPGIAVTIIAMVILSVNLLVFPSWTFQKLFPQIILDLTSINLIFMGVWFSFVFCTFAFLPISYILAFKDTYFSLFMGFVNWITGFLFIYTFIKILEVSPDYFWLLMTFSYFITALLYYLRAIWLIEQCKRANSLCMIESKA
ncbi:MAG: MATE family efflux transporter [Bacteroidota bacterium]|nr:MATE family efflux transporter [Bacteroidota bacterium]